MDDFSLQFSNVTTVVVGLMENVSRDLRDENNSEEDLQEEDSYDDIGWEIPSVPYVTCIDLTAGLGIIGNILIIILMTSPPQRRFSYAVYMMFLAVSDSLVLLIIAIEDTTDNIFHVFLKMIGSHVAVCKVWYTLQSSFTIISPWLLVVMTFDRYIAVVFPLSKSRYCQVKYAIIISLSVCLIAFCINTPFLHFLELIQYHDELECGSDNMNFANFALATSTLMDSVLPVTLLLILNIHTGVVLRRVVKSGPRRANSRRNLNESNILKITTSLIVVSVLSAVALVPFAVNALVESVVLATGGDPIVLQTTGRIWKILNVVRLLNYAMNFYVLMASSQHYRHLLRKKFRCPRCHVRKPGTKSHVQFDDLSSERKISTITTSNVSL